jgi:hypothetical protein
MDPKRPYLVIPKLIKQPTWGGTYIRKLKGWDSLSFLKDIKIGQSYELYGNSKLALAVTDTQDPKFIPEIGFPDKPDILAEHFPLREHEDWETLPSGMPLLIKVNQANGNSFQIHIRTGDQSAHWKPKPESWYFLEPGDITFGIQNNTNLGTYRDICEQIDAGMHDLSAKVKDGKLSLAEARKKAEELVAKANPWQFVNRLETAKYDVVDLSGGGIHHSWEENPNRALGNVVYEVQLDVMDPISTIRAFDQGKIKDNGDVRSLNIEDYFRYLDTDPSRNDVSNARQKPNGEQVLKSMYYRMEEIAIDKPRSFDTGNSFAHIFVREGRIRVDGGSPSLRVGSGHSCFVPREVGRFSIVSDGLPSVILKTSI